MGGIHLWETLKESIVAYTGLPPTTFFTLLALLFAFYYVVSDLFGSSSSNRPNQPNHEDDDDESEKLPPLKPPVQLGEITEEDLKLYDGSNPEKPLLMAIKGHIYDVSQSRMFYGPGGPYALFAGKDASRALAKMSFEEKDLTGDISGLGPFELEALQDWEYKFMEKYAKVGTIKSIVPVTNAESTVEPSESTTSDVDDVKPNEDGQSETAAVNHGVDDVKPTRVVDDAKPTEDGQSETAAVTHDVDDVKPTHVVDDVKPTEYGQSETATVKHGVDDVKPTRVVDDAKPTEDGQSETAAVTHDETPSNVDHQQTRHFKEEELGLYDGSDPEKPLLMAIKGQIYDVSQSRMIYGPDGPYALFAGKDASRALAKMSFEEEDLTGNISGLGPSELEALQNWENKFMEKYAKVGTIKV